MTFAGREREVATAALTKVEIGRIDQAVERRVRHADVAFAAHAMIHDGDAATVARQKPQEMGEDRGRDGAAEFFNRGLFFGRIPVFAGEGRLKCEEGVGDGVHGVKMVPRLHRLRRGYAPGAVHDHRRRCGKETVPPRTLDPLRSSGVCVAGKKQAEETVQLRSPPPGMVHAPRTRQRAGRESGPTASNSEFGSGIEAEAAFALLLAGLLFLLLLLLRLHRWLGSRGSDHGNGCRSSGRGGCGDDGLAGDGRSGFETHDGFQDLMFDGMIRCGSPTSIARAVPRCSPVC